MLSLDASLAIPPRVLRLEASRRTWIPSLSRRALGLGFVDQPRNLVGFVVNHQKPRKCRAASTPSIGHAKPFTSGSRTVYSVLPRSMTWPPRSPRLLVVIVAQPTNRTRLHLAFLAPCDPHLIPSGPGSIEPSLLVSPSLRRPPWHRSFSLVLHLHQRKSSRNLHLQY